jgi:hypothetical protein
VLPVISRAVPDKWWLSSVLFPPLNDAYRLPALLTTGLVTILVYGLHESPFITSGRKQRHLAWLVFACVLVGLSAYLMSTERFVKTVDRPAVGDAATVAVGYERTDFARQTFGNATDEEMLRQRGTTNEEVFRLWTTRSVLIGRCALLLSYVLFLASAVGVLSLQVLYSVVKGTGP